jgi:hypothetical protein
VSPRLERFQPWDIMSSLIRLDWIESEHAPSYGTEATDAKCIGWPSPAKTVVLAVLIVGSIDRAGETCVQPGKAVTSCVQR